MTVGPFSAGADDEHVPGSDTHPAEDMIRKLARLRDLGATERHDVRSLSFRVESLPAGHQVMREGAYPSECCILLDGYACRYKLTPGGMRQIVSFHVPGDIFGVQHLMLQRADHSIMANTTATVAWVAAQDIRQLLMTHPAINEAFWRDTLIEASVFREWVLNVGRREAKERIAHMLCEFMARRKAAGLGELERAALPMTQQEIADATGLTPVHVNRMLHALMDEGVIARQSRAIEIADLSRMQRVAGFDPAYLHVAA